MQSTYYGAFLSMKGTSLKTESQENEVWAFLCPRHPAVPDTQPLQITEMNGTESGSCWSKEGRVSVGGRDSV